MIYLGIDPGLSGAVMRFDSDTGLPSYVCDMPVFEINGKRRLDLQTLACALDTANALFRYRGLKAVIEEPNAMPGQGVSSMFKFGFCCGATQGIVAAFEIPVTLVRPNIWKRALGLTADKDSARMMASRLWPQCAGLWARKKDDGRAEAALLAWYGFKTEGAAR